MRQIIKSSIFLLLALILPAIANAHDFVVDGIYYNINGNEATVTYKGSSYNSYSGSVTIPSTVTYGGTTYSVTAIGDYAFYRCSELTNVTIPNSVTSIGDDAFVACSGLTSINIPNSVTSIGDNAFYGCTGLTSIDIPYSVTSIGVWAFYNCSGLTSISVDNGNSKYDSRNNCNAIIETASNSLILGCRNTIIPYSVTSIGNSAFYGCTVLTSIDIPNSVTSIGGHAFYGCSGLASINIPNSVTSIGGNAFTNCSELTSINIPNSVTSIGYSTFSGCSRLTSIDIGNFVTSIGNSAFYGCSGLTSINIPNSVTSIGSTTFYGCSGLTNINIGNSVTSIGERAFYGCKNLTNVYCYAVNPPTCFENTFETYSATLHVPASSLAAYFTAPYWCNFENIIGDAVLPTAITISKDTVNLQLTEQIKLTATVTPANASNKVISWHSTNSDIATVDNGNVTAISIGECDIIATCFGMSDTCHITVTNPIKLDHQEAMLLPNHILTLTPTAPAVPEGYTASSSDPTVAAARVMNGKVQVVGIKEGTTTITVNSSDGTAQPATCLVTVYTELGDLNVDGFVTISDVTALIDYLLGGEVNPFNSGNADVNGDQALTITDMTALIDLLLSGND